MRYRTFLFAIPWVLVLIATPEVLGDFYSLHLPPDVRLPVFNICMAIIYSAPVVGIVLGVTGLVTRIAPMAIHGGVTCLLSLGILMYADTIPPRRFYAVDNRLSRVCCEH